MSPYVWRNRATEFSMLFRVVDDSSETTGSLWLAQGDGLTFQLDPTPVLTPGPEDFDIGGCEDPTVVQGADACLVYYTGLTKDGVAQLLWADGPDIRTLKKRGVAHASTASDRNTKEATVARHGDEWLILFEYSSDGHSRIGRGESASPAGPWRETADPITIRERRWDSWHLSTGPILLDEPGGPIMFYNGADVDAVWQIGWAQFDEKIFGVRRRSGPPLVTAPEQAGRGGRKMTFAASMVQNQGFLWLYFTHDDRSLRRAELRRRAPDRAPGSTDARLTTRRSTSAEV